MMKHHALASSISISISIYLFVYHQLSATIFAAEHNITKYQLCDDHFRPFLDALSLQIKSTILRPTYNSDVHFSSRTLFPLQKLPLLPGPSDRRPIDSGSTDRAAMLMRTNVHELKLSLKYLSSLDRFDAYAKHQARRYIFDAFNNFNLKSTKQSFKAESIEHHGVNIIGIRAGTLRQKYEHKNESADATSKPVNDKILIIGAHYDTVRNTTGLNDNGSGVAVMLELVRLLDYFRCVTKHSVIFVAFDLEEMGALGSKYFVHEYLIPNELNNARYRSRYQGAIIMDTLLNFDSKSGAQDIPNDIHKNVPQFSASIKRNNYSGDFLAMFARTKNDEHIANLIEHQWKRDDSSPLSSGRRTPEIVENDRRRFRLRPIPIDSLSSEKVTNFDELQRHINMLRSDHLHFWYHNHSDYQNSLSAVLLTDTGPFRGYMRYCYHRMCDDTRFLTDNNVNFVKKTIDVLLQVILQVVEGQCYFSGKSVNRG